MVINETSSIYLMHKYWGKKPSNELNKIISLYSNENDTLLDPFSGFGGFGVEAVLQNRNVILNDLNPAATFISKNLLSYNVDTKKLKVMFADLKSKYEEFRKEWYSYKGKEILTILRDSNDNPLKLRLLDGKKSIKVALTNEERKEFLDKENNYKIKTWFPTDDLISNSRISAKVGMSNNNLFPKRALICQSLLYDLIKQYEDSPEKDLLLFTFTSNLANCSKLVPPITSRGDMAQGAWMTGFYIGVTYLENNVFHYFENRAKKTIKGKETYLKLREKYGAHTTYKITNNDAKKLLVQNDTIDLVFTDFPYGDTVPYFEQSQLWNHWLKFNVDYDNEIVVSDSSIRNKDILNFEKGIDESICEISRVLKDNKYFVFTFHSLSGREWLSIVKALKKYNFVFSECEVLLQKTLPPRQLNRNSSIKGDIVAVYKKDNNKHDSLEFKECFEVYLKDNINKNMIFETNDLIVMIIKTMLKNNCLNNIEFGEIINDYFLLDINLNKWRLK